MLVDGRRYQFSASAPVFGRLVPALFAPVLLCLAVHSDRHKSVGLNILKLDDLMPAPGKLTTTAPLGTSPDREYGSVARIVLLYFH